ncbi:MAG: hypothetical protein ACREBR_05625 [bacterium]
MWLLIPIFVGCLWFGGLIAKVFHTSDDMAAYIGIWTFTALVALVFLNPHILDR